MKGFLKGYCNYILNKPTVKIDDTIDYIEENELYTIEIKNTYKNIFNVDKICKLINNERFLSNNEYAEKIQIFCNFFNNLHNYARNLIKHFDIYSAKTIQTSSIVIKENLMLFPHYKRYMEIFLGYEFDTLKSEWVMRQDNSWELRLNLAAVCIITALGFQKIDELDGELSSSDGGRSSDSASIIDSLPTKDRQMAPGKWNCGKCGFTNTINNGGCEVCFEEEIPIRNSGDNVTMDNIPEIVENRQRYDVNKWTCKHCSLANENNDEQCKACLENRDEKLSTIKPRGKTWICKYCTCRNEDGVEQCGACNQDRPGQVASNVELWNCSRCSFENRSESKICGRCSTGRRQRSSNSVHVIMRPNSNKNQWECDKCTFMNNVKDNTCVTCLRGKLPRSSSVQEFETSVYVNVEGSNPKTAEMKNKWTCKYCQASNNDHLVSCGCCRQNRARRDLQPSKPMETSSSRLVSNARRSTNVEDKQMPSKSQRNNPTTRTWTCKYCACSNEYGVGQCRECKKNILHQVASNRQQWNCSKCTFKNRPESQVCGNCSTPKRQQTFNNLPVVIPTTAQTKKWRCDKCTYRNNVEDKTCGVCYEAKYVNLGSSNAKRPEMNETLTQRDHQSPKTIQNRPSNIPNGIPPELISRPRQNIDNQRLENPPFKPNQPQMAGKARNPIDSRNAPNEAKKKKKRTGIRGFFCFA